MRERGNSSGVEGERDGTVPESSGESEEMTIPHSVFSHRTPQPLSVESEAQFQCVVHLSHRSCAQTPDNRMNPFLDRDDSNLVESN